MRDGHDAITAARAIVQAALRRGETELAAQPSAPSYLRVIYGYLARYYAAFPRPPGASAEVPKEI